MNSPEVEWLCNKIEELQIENANLKQDLSLAVSFSQAECDELAQRASQALLLKHARDDARKKRIEIKELKKIIRQLQ